MAEHDAAAAAKEAAADAAVRQAIEAAGLVIMIVISVAMQRYVHDPDLGRTLRMRAARAAEGRLARLGIWALKQAERQRQVYEGMAHG